MRNNIIFWFIILGLISVFGCAKEKSENIALRINQFVMSAEEFKEEFKNSSYFVEGKDKGKFLDDLVNRKLLLQEAERMELDREQDFLKEIELFWEKTLLKSVVNQKSKEFAGKSLVGEDEIRSRYDIMAKEGLTDETFEELYAQMKWQLLREKQTIAFNHWLEKLHKEARLEVNKQLLEIQ